MAGTGGNLDDGGILLSVDEPSVADQARAAWVLLGSAAEQYGAPLSAQLHRDVEDVLGMLGVLAPDVLKHKPGGGRRGYIRKRR